MRDELSLEQKLEAMLTVALEPISAAELADVVEEDVGRVDDALRLLRTEFLEQRRGFQVVELASAGCCSPRPMSHTGWRNLPIATFRTGSVRRHWSRSPSLPIVSQFRVLRLRRCAA